jgi:cell division cycle protein 37
MVDYSKWKNIEVSDDEDDVHPNIDTPSLFRWRHQARIERMEDEKKEKEEFEWRKKMFVARERDLNLRKKAGKEDVTELEEELAKEEKELKEIDESMKKKERLTPWNVDTIGQESYSKTVINTPKPKVNDDEKELTEEEKAIRFKEFVKEKEPLLKQYGMLKKYEDTKNFLLDHPELVCDDTGNFLVYWCIDLALEEKFDLLDHISHQCIAMQFLIDLGRQLDRDPRVSNNKLGV